MSRWSERRKARYQNIKASIDNRRIWYWIVSIGENGKRVIYDKCDTLEKANAKAGSISNDVVEVIPLNTSDESHATRMLRAKVLHDTGSISDSLNKFRHNKEYRNDEN